MSESDRADVLAKVDALYAEYGRGHDGMQLPYVTRCYRAVVRHQDLPPENPGAAPSRAGGRRHRRRPGRSPREAAGGSRHAADRLQVTASQTVEPWRSRPALAHGRWRWLRPVTSAATPTGPPSARCTPPRWPAPALRDGPEPRARPSVSLKHLRTLLGTPAVAIDRHRAPAGVGRALDATTPSRRTRRWPRSGVADGSTWCRTTRARLRRPRVPVRKAIVSPLLVEDRVVGTLWSRPDRPSAGLRARDRGGRRLGLGTARARRARRVAAPADARPRCGRCARRSARTSSTTP